MFQNKIVNERGHQQHEDWVDNVEGRDQQIGLQFEIMVVCVIQPEVQHDVVGVNDFAISVVI